MIFMCLRLCIVYHLSSSNPCSCLSFNIITSLSLSLLEICLLCDSLMDNFSCHGETIKFKPPVSSLPLSPSRLLIFPPLLSALDSNLMSPLRFPFASNNIQACDSSRMTHQMGNLWTASTGSHWRHNTAAYVLTADKFKTGNALI